MAVPPSGGDAVDAVCADLLGALPDEVDPGVERRPVQPDSGRTAAWGDPAVVLECGVPPPERLEPPQLVNDVLWTVRDVGAGFRWTTSGRTVNVALTIPDAYNNGVEIVLPVVPVVSATVPVDPAAPDPLQPGSPGLEEPAPLGGPTSGS